MSIMAKNNLNPKSKKPKKKSTVMKSKVSREQIKGFKITGKLEKEISKIQSVKKGTENKRSNVKIQNATITKKKEIIQKKRKITADLSNDSIDTLSSSRKKKKNKKKIKSLEETPAHLNDAPANDYEEQSMNILENNKPNSLPQVGFTWGSTMDELNLLQPGVGDESEDEEEEVEAKKVKTKMTKAEKSAAAKAAEAKIRKAEDELLENAEPVSPDAFDRMLLAQPDNSELWVKYMAYHLQATEIEKARSVARRALSVINIRNEEDRLNVWTSLLNLEHLYGTKESLTSSLHEAVRCNDEIKVYTNMMDIYAGSGQIRELDSTVKLLLKKAGQNHSSVNIYLQCATRLLKLGQMDTARHILQRGLNTLPAAVHVTLISRFALAENKFGDPTRAQALLEHTLTTYPSRVDVWSVYVDMLLKTERLDLARQVIQRAVTQKLPPKKLKPLYMKWLKLEEQYGDEESIESVKKEIETYVRETKVKLGNAKLAL